ncbi:hypothetical protein QUF72_01545 [Desulfobacterales bacterium HSG2]|nr:hypothetical protein [Desulfobacterales bacterium HSG2]
MTKSQVILDLSSLPEQARIDFYEFLSPKNIMPFIKKNTDN